jgi:hypothetical protein
MKSWIIKFNSGNLAILCSKCSKIIKEGKDFTEEELDAVQNSTKLSAYYCDGCKTKYRLYKSRYGEERHFELQEDGNYLVWGESYYMRSGGLQELDYVDYSGGPFISVGLDMKCFGLQGTIKEIKPELDSDKPSCYRLIVK